MKPIQTSAAPAAIGPYSQAVLTGQTLYLSGQIPLNPQGQLVEGISAQIDQVVVNLRAVLEAAGGRWGQIVKTTIFVTDLSNFAEVNAAYARHFQPPFPARSTVQVAALPRGAAV